MTFSATLLLGLLGVQLGGTGSVPGFHPDEVLNPPGGPEVVVFQSVPPEVVSLRLSVPFEESVAEAGAGQLIRIQAHDRMEILAARIGARVEVHRTPQAIVYHVSGTAADLDFLGWILREGLRPPSAQDFEGARRQARADLDRGEETPQGVLFQQVRASLIPGAAPLLGTPGSLDRMEAWRLETIWARSHRRESLRLVVAARLPAATILASVADLGLPPEAPAPEVAPIEAGGAQAPRPEVIRHWTVDAYPLPPDREARALVAAHWMGEQLRSLGGDFETGVEIWDLGGTRTLVISGAAYPRSRQSMENRIRTIPTDASTSLSESDVVRIAEALRTEILMTARTPWGLTELVGQAWDAGHGPDGVDSLLAELESLRLSEVATLLGELAAASPVREALNP